MPYEKKDFQTIDELIDYTVSSGELKYVKHLNEYQFLLLCASYIVLQTLRSETNKPSVHDLQFIIHIMKDKQDNDTNKRDILRNQNMDNILWFYKNRKV